MTAAPSESNDLAQLRAVWQRETPTSLSVRVDAQSLRATLHRRRNHLRLMMLLDLAVAVGVLALAVRIVTTMSDARWMFWAGAVSVFAVAATAATAYIRRPLWSIDLDVSVGELVRTSMRQLRASLAIARLTYVIVGMAFLLLLAWGFFGMGDDAAPSGAGAARTWFAYGFSVVYGLAFVFGAARMAAAKRRELAQWEVTAADLATASALEAGVTPPSAAASAPRDANP